MAKALGATVYATAGSPEKVELCESLGADRAINYHDEDFVEVLKEAGGADVILDNMGGKYLGRNVAALATEGRLVIIGMQGGSKGELDIAKLLGKRGAVIATSLRARPSEEKGAICARWSSTSGRCSPRARCARSCTRRCRSRRPAAPTS